MKILLTFDVEEADVLNVEKEKQFVASREGLLYLIDMLNQYNIKATLFTTTSFAQKYPKLIRDLNNDGHEIASHGYIHSDSYFSDLSNIPLAKKEIEKIIKKQVNGFRAPRFEIKRISELSNFGFKYDSSLHPTLMPGKYMGIFKKRKIHDIGSLIEIPPSVLPLIRLPIAWVFFKNFGKTYPKIFTKINNLFSDYTMLIFHPWEFSDLSNMNLSPIIKRKHGRELLDMLENYIIFCKKNNYQFFTVSDYLKLS
jgi:peptidoglycan/xylan/chitin deacetylase (PgdA/CDA1 family)